MRSMPQPPHPADPPSPFWLECLAALALAHGFPGTLRVVPSPLSRSNKEIP
jgi:hypothetical protein